MNTIKFDKKLKCGPEYVAVRILDNADDMKVGQIYLSKDIASNGRLAFAIVEDVGKTAAEKRGIAAGDYVLVDRLSTFGHTHPVAALKYGNVIAKTDEKRSAMRPLLGMVLVEDGDGDPKVGQIYVPGYSDKLKTGRVVEANLTSGCELHLEAGDEIVLTKKADAVDFGGKSFSIYHEEDIVAMVVSETAE